LLVSAGSPTVVRPTLASAHHGVFEFLGGAMRFVRKLRYAWRSLCGNPGLSVIILLTLTLGIGANTAIFTLDYATLFAPVPYPQPEQL
jgi:hypothetical protein